MNIHSNSGCITLYTAGHLYLLNQSYFICTQHIEGHDMKQLVQKRAREPISQDRISSSKPLVPIDVLRFGDECRPVKIKRIVEGYHCGEGTSIFKFDIILNYKLWPIIQKYYDGKPTLVRFKHVVCNVGCPYPIVTQWCRARMQPKKIFSK